MHETSSRTNTFNTKLNNIDDYTEKKKNNNNKKRNNRPPRIFEFNGKTLIISGLLMYDSHSWDVRVYHAKKLTFISIKIE